MAPLPAWLAKVERAPCSTWDELAAGIAGNDGHKQHKMCHLLTDAEARVLTKEVHKNNAYDLPWVKRMLLWGKCKASCIAKRPSLDCAKTKKPYKGLDVLPRKLAYVYDRGMFPRALLREWGEAPGTNDDNTATASTYWCGLAVHYLRMCLWFTSLGSYGWHQKYKLLPIANGCVWDAPIGWGGAVPVFANGKIEFVAASSGASEEEDDAAVRAGLTTLGFVARPDGAGFDVPPAWL